MHRHYLRRGTMMGTIGVPTATALRILPKMSGPSSNVYRLSLSRVDQSATPQPNFADSTNNHPAISELEKLAVRLFQTGSEITSTFQT